MNVQRTQIALRVLDRLLAKFGPAMKEDSEINGADAVDSIMEILHDATAALKTIPNEGLKPYSVIAIHEDNGQIVCHHVLARDGLNAFTPIAHIPGIEMVVAFEGHLTEESGLTYPGEGLVCGKTVLEQTDVFGTPPDAVESE